MDQKPISNAEIVRVLRPWYPVFDRAFLTGQADARCTVPYTGVHRPGERAVVLHATIREAMRDASRMARPFLTLVEEPENEGRLDYLRVEWAGTELAVRWGRYKDGRISRRDSTRQESIQEQGVLFNGMDKEIEELPVVAIGYTVEDDALTLMNVPQWWMGRLVLMRERVGDSEPIQEITAFDKPETIEPPDLTRDPRIVARESEIDHMKRIIREIRKAG